MVEVIAKAPIEGFLSTITVCRGEVAVAAVAAAVVAVVVMAVVLVVSVIGVTCVQQAGLPT